MEISIPKCDIKVPKKAKKQALKPKCLKDKRSIPLLCCQSRLRKNENLFLTIALNTCGIPMNSDDSQVI